MATTAPTADVPPPPSNTPSQDSAPHHRQPPQDIDAEMALLGSMMMSRDVIGEIIPIIGPGDAAWFYVPAHQKLFELLLDLYDDPTKAIDLLVVSDELRRRDLLDFVGGQEYMIALAESFAESANAEYYAKIVQDKGMLRDLIRCTQEVADQAYKGFDEARDILDMAEQKVFEVTERRISGQSSEIRVAVAKLAEQLKSGAEGACSGLPTGFVQLDEYLSGLQKGDLIILAGRPSMGKTALGLAMAKNIALDRDAPKAVGFFSMEMGVDQLAQRLLCSYSKVEAQKLRQRALSEKDKRELLDACAVFEKAPLYINDSPGLSVMELRSAARRMKQRHGIEAIFVDYLQLMNSPRAENRQVEISTISRGLKALARELEVPIVAMAQLNRMPEGRADKKPLMSDLRESGAIEQDADVVLLIHREAYYNREDDSIKNQAELIIAKQRNGPTGNLTLHFDQRYTFFADHCEREEPYRPAGSNDVPF